MKQRIITAVIALLAAVPIVWIGGLPFELVISVLGLIGFMEAMQMARINVMSPEALIGSAAMLGLLLPASYYAYFRLTPLLLLSLCAFLLLIITVFSENKFSFERVGVVTLSALYVGLGGHYVIEIRQEGFWTILFVLAISWITDSGAYFVGRAIGKRKLAPHISPNKSVEGAVGGVIAAVIFSWIYGLFYQPFQLDVIGMSVLTLFVSLAGQLGDLVESALKRFYQVKDSGNILPGHGGVLDRFDSTLFGAVACHLMLIVLK